MIKSRSKSFGENSRGLFYGQGSVLWPGVRFMAGDPFYGRGSVLWPGGWGSQHINLGGVSFMVKADLRPFLASLGIVYGRRRQRTDFWGHRPDAANKLQFIKQLEFQGAMRPSF